MERSLRETLIGAWRLVDVVKEAVDGSPDAVRTATAPSGSSSTRRTATCRRRSWTPTAVRSPRPTGRAHAGGVRRRGARLLRLRGLVEVDEERGTDPLRQVSLFPGWVGGAQLRVVRLDGDASSSAAPRRRSPAAGWSSRGSAGCAPARPRSPPGAVNTDILVTVLAGILLVVAAVGTIYPVLPGSLIAIVTLLLWAWAMGSWPAWIGGDRRVAHLRRGLVGERRAHRPQAQAARGAQAGRSSSPSSAAWSGMFLIPVVGIFVGFAVALLLSEWVRHRSLRQAFHYSVQTLKATGTGVLIEFLLVCVAASVWTIGVDRPLHADLTLVRTASGPVRTTGACPPRRGTAPRSRRARRCTTAAPTASRPGWP